MTKRLICFSILFLLSSAAHAAQICNEHINMSTPDSRFVDNGDGTVTDSITGLMWNQCAEGLSGSSCENGSELTFNWKGALQHVASVNNSGGSNGYDDWRAPNINELASIAELKCAHPAINQNVFPGMPSTNYFWSSSYHTSNSGPMPLLIDFSTGADATIPWNFSEYALRLVRGGM